LAQSGISDIRTPSAKKITLLKSKMAVVAILKNQTIMITKTVSPILTKYGTLMHLGLLHTVSHRMTKYVYSKLAIKQQI